MARPNRGRSIASEANLARRIAYEREQRGLSYEALAKLMTDAGCAIQGSAIYKIEKGTPPRRVAVDELVGLSRALGVSVDELLTPMDLIEQRRAQAVIAELDEVERLLGETVERTFNLYAEYFALAAENPDLREYVDHHRFSDAALRELPPPSIGALIVNGVEVGDSLDDVRDAMAAFHEALINAAADRVERAIREGA